MRRQVATLVVLAMLAIGACSDDDGQSQPAGRGSAACHEWQSAYCARITRCQGPAVACDQAKAIDCASDAQAESCANALSSATCQVPPSNCSLPDVADAAPAQKACDDLLLALCQRSDECQAGTLDACLEQIKGMIDCANAIGVMLPYESCMPEVRKLACASPT